MIPDWENFSLFKRLLIIIIFGCSFTTIYYFSKFYKYLEKKAYKLKMSNKENDLDPNLNYRYNEMDELYLADEKMHN